MGNPTQSQIDQWNAAVKQLAEREGIDEELAQIKLIKFMESGPVQDAIRTEVYDRLDYLEGQSADHKARLEVLEGVEQR